jgi:hypothetical protein
MENKDVCSHMTIVNRDMILMLNELTSRDVNITNNNNGEKEFVTIYWDTFTRKVNDLI